MNRLVISSRYVFVVMNMLREIICPTISAESDKYENSNGIWAF